MDCLDTYLEAYLDASSKLPGTIDIGPYMTGISSVGKSNAILALTDGLWGPPYLNAGTAKNLSIVAGGNLDSNEDDSMEKGDFSCGHGRGCGCRFCECRLAFFAEEPPSLPTSMERDGIVDDLVLKRVFEDWKMDQMCTFDFHEIGGQQWLPPVEAGSLLPPNMRAHQMHHMPLETTLSQHYYQPAARLAPGPSWAPNPTMQAFTPTLPTQAYDSSPELLEQSSADMDSCGLDYEILNNPIYLEDFDLTGYYDDFGLINYNDFALPDYIGDFTLFPTNDSFLGSPFTYDDSLFPPLPSYDSPASVVPADSNSNSIPVALPPNDSPTNTGTSPIPRFPCPSADCSESFPRQCELTRHEFKHTRPFKCPHCGRAFAEKRRCVQHVQSVHGLATDKDKTKCQLCEYAHVRPDAVKRHLRLKHGVGLKVRGSPDSSVSGKSSQGRGPGRRKGNARATR
ncbi:hypothetical protein H2200_002208 [Cladophialophora chaetospira]|uniref:C2H2-type domain-containing protein n=1 Tax=Cladophialophora chaetospira TaxID=386627 RepID=A0AA38XIG6_9EURO|nr:hypothetical protein H2200_002208 [Cladophialophora chaetospira]